MTFFGTIDFLKEIQLTNDQKWKDLKKVSYWWNKKQVGAANSLKKKEIGITRQNKLMKKFTGKIHITYWLMDQLNMKWQ